MKRNWEYIDDVTKIIYITLCACVAIISICCNQTVCYTYNMYDNELGVSANVNYLSDKYKNNRIDIFRKIHCSRTETVDFGSSLLVAGTASIHNTPKKTGDKKTAESKSKIPKIKQNCCECKNNINCSYEKLQTVVLQKCKINFAVFIAVINTLII